MAFLLLTRMNGKDKVWVNPAFIRQMERFGEELQEDPSKTVWSSLLDVLPDADARTEITWSNGSTTDVKEAPFDIIRDAGIIDRVS